MSDQTSYYNQNKYREQDNDSVFDNFVFDNSAAYLSQRGNWQQF